MAVCQVLSVVDSDLLQFDLRVRCSARRCFLWLSLDWAFPSPKVLLGDIGGGLRAPPAGLCAPWLCAPPAKVPGAKVKGMSGPQQARSRAQPACRRASDSDPRLALYYLCDVGNLLNLLNLGVLAVTRDSGACGVVQIFSNRSPPMGHAFYCPD